ncbi:hypothetical protein PVK06_024379 [Gossypium arboreum]|uniref:Uncharacterized protein n=1 Tax=Gossypium arboreum TaxID=29729 RepID=A0ABR0PDJ6_GOSAR|nr:hypothetical protein PVK06_024379 [Gossypium arboreum]
MKYPPIMHVSDNEKEEDSRDIEGCMRRIDILVAGNFIAGQEVPAVEEEVDVGEEEFRVTAVNEKVKEEKTKKEVVENISNASEVVGATTDNLEQDRAKPVKATEVLQVARVIICLSEFLSSLHGSVIALESAATVQANKRTNGSCLRIRGI